jgi:hypothetical protein
MSKKNKNYPVAQRVNWALTCEDKMYVNYRIYKGADEYGNFDCYNTLTYKYPINGVISFNNHLHLFTNITPIASAFLIYLSQTMESKTNEVHLDLSTRTHFLSFLQNSCSQVYKDGTVKKAISDLEKTGYILKRSNARRRTINPLYFFRGTMNDREKLIKELLYEAYYPKKQNKHILKHVLKAKI